MRVLNRYLGGTGVSSIVELLEVYGIASNAWTQGNDHATLLSARSNDYSTLFVAYSNDWVTWNAAISNDAMTLLSARSNDFSTYLDARSNDYVTWASATALAASNDHSTLFSAYSNDFSTLQSARSNDYSTYTTLTLAFQANDYVTLLAGYSNDYSTLTAARSNDYSTYTAASANDYLGFVAVTINSSIQFANTALSIKFVGQPAGFWSPTSNVIYANVSGEDVTYWANNSSGNVFGIMGNINVQGDYFFSRANAQLFFRRHDSGANPSLRANGSILMLSNGHFAPTVTDTYTLGRSGIQWATVFTRDVRVSNVVIFADDSVQIAAGVGAGEAIGYAIALGG